VGGVVAVLDRFREPLEPKLFVFFGCGVDGHVCSYGALTEAKIGSHQKYTVPAFSAHAAKHDATVGRWKARAADKTARAERA